MIGVGEIASGVLAGYDGMLFLAGGAHDPLAAATGARAIETASIRNFESNLARRATLAAAYDARYVHVLFPDKHTVLPQLVPFATDPLGPRFVARLSPETRVSLLDPLEALRAMSSPPFPRLDTHLTDRATCLVAALVVERLTGAPSHETDARLAALITRDREQPGDLGGKLDPPAVEHLRVFASDPRVVTVSNTMQGGNNGITDLHRNHDAPDAARLLIFGDSFSRRLAYALAVQFAEVLFCRSPFLHDEILAQMRPDLVVTANVERYLSRVACDDEAPSYLLYPWLSTATCRPDPGFATALAATLRGGRRVAQGGFATTPFTAAG